MFRLDPQMQALAESARSFARREIAPVVDEAERNEVFPRELFAKAGQAGFIGMRMPESVGGAGAGIIAEVIWREETSKICGGIGSALSVPGNIGAFPIFEFGTPEQQQTYLPKVTGGEWIGAWALTEPDAGSDVKGIRSTAEKVSGGWKITGQKIFITLAFSADFLLYTAYTDRSLGHTGIGTFIIDRDRMPEGSVSKLETVGHRSGEIGEFAVDGLFVPDEALVGEPTGGFARAARTLNGGRLIVAGGALGTAAAALDAGVEYAKQREAFGKKIGDFQAVAFRLAQCAAQLDTSRAAVYAASQLWDAGEETPREIASAKLIATEACVEIASEAMRTFGGYGYIAGEFNIERLWRDSRMYVIVEGTTDIQKLIISRQLGLNPR